MRLAENVFVALRVAARSAAFDSAPAGMSHSHPKGELAEYPRREISARGLREVQPERPNCGRSATGRHCYEKGSQFRHIESCAGAAGGLDAVAASVRGDDIDMAGAADQQGMTGCDKQIVSITARRTDRNRAASGSVDHRDCVQGGFPHQERVTARSEGGAGGLRNEFGKIGW